MKIPPDLLARMEQICDGLQYVKNTGLLLFAFRLSRRGRGCRVHALGRSRLSGGCRAVVHVRRGCRRRSDTSHRRGRRRGAGAGGGRGRGAADSGRDEGVLADAAAGGECRVGHEFVGHLESDRLVYVGYGTGRVTLVCIRGKVRLSCRQSPLDACCWPPGGQRPGRPGRSQGQEQRGWCGTF